MAITANNLITQAYYLADIVGIDYETLTGSQASVGLQLLNGIIGEVALDAILIPYFTHQSFNTAYGQETYVVNNLIEVSTMTYNLDSDVRYSLTRESINRYFGWARVNNLISLPQIYTVEREHNASKIYMYPIPDKVYQVNITGKFMLADVQFNDVLTNTYDVFYLKWLKYRLAYELDLLNGMDVNPKVQEQLANLERRVNKLVGTDLLTNKFQMISHRPGRGDAYLQANFPSAWWP
jgi:hypothetical protein